MMHLKSLAQEGELQPPFFSFFYCVLTQVDCQSADYTTCLLVDFLLEEARKTRLFMH